MKKLRTWIIWGFCLAAVVAVFALWDSSAGLPVRLATVERGDIRAFVEDRAKTSLPRHLVVTMPLAGRVLPIAKRAGDPVTRGEIVARLDPADLDTALTRARADCDRLDAAIAAAENMDLETTALTEAGGWIETLTRTAQAADELIKANEAHTQFSQWWLKAVKQLKVEGAMATEKLQRAQSENAQAMVDLATSKLTSQAIWAIKTTFDLGPKFVKEYITLKNMKTDGLRQERLAAGARLDQAKRDRARAEIASPVTGLVLDRLVDDERVLPAGAPLLTVGDPARLEVTADILSQEAGPIRAGAPVAISGEAIGPAPLRGTVERVSPQGFTKVSSLGVEQQRVRVTVRFKPGELEHLRAAGRDLGVGYRVWVRIRTGQAEKALVVPRLAVFRDEAGGWRVFVVRGGKAASVPVRIGLTNASRTQILDGIEENDTVVVSPPKTLTDGTAVKAVDAS